MKERGGRRDNGWEELVCSLRCKIKIRPNEESFMCFEVSAVLHGYGEGTKIIIGEQSSKKGEGGWLISQTTTRRRGEGLKMHKILEDLYPYFSRLN